ncbi:hypothetical protein DB41_GM00020 [Neochlamydia sp. TUME1]|uniref:hypothetical protein n=1 Tax=Neochlamydia sp. TUME1 TaxID=1478174 RepID=UPI00057CEDC8|nr:hypothetical protein [Neochlamydia sp. TUME1]KIC76124.1 hypothetical protein DB41_GM00020 [Neochlamydia sp. TUME1]
MTAHSHRVKVTIDVSEDERTYIKMLAAKKRMTISDFIMSFVRPNIPHGHPNAETQKAMRDVDERKNLTHCKTIEEFWAAVRIDPNA